MALSYTWKIGGEAGLGIMSAGLMFSKTCARHGLNLFDYTEYPSLVRGGHNVMEVRFSDQPVYSQTSSVHLLIALNQETVDLHACEIVQSGGLIYDADKIKLPPNPGYNLYPLPFAKLIADLSLSSIVANTIALGASVALLKLDLAVLKSVITTTFKSKGAQVIADNHTAAQAGYDYIVANLPHYICQDSCPIIAKRDLLVMTGNEMLSLAAIAAGCQFYASYPMTPSSSVLHYLAAKAPQTNMLVRHAEDEIGVINEALGAAFAGVRAMVGTSGGGFALMTEGVSLAGITETPLVIFVSQRPGPATGMPTWTEQGDLRFIIHSGHGEFFKIVLAPGDLPEIYDQTQLAFNLADQYQTPVFILLDKYISESHATLEKAYLTNHRLAINRGKFAPRSQADLSPFPRYEDSPDGISPRILPGTPNYYYQANSYEHTPVGYTSESVQDRQIQLAKRAKKQQTYLKTTPPIPTLYGPAKAPITLVGWGSTKGPILEALKTVSCNYLHFNQLWPLASESLTPVLNQATRLVLVENNATGQLGSLIAEITGIQIKDQLLKSTGRPFYPEEIVNYVTQL